MKLKIWIIILVIAMNSCQDTSKPILVNRTDFSLSLPGFLKEDELAEDGIVEYANRFRNFYLVVVSDSGKSSNFDFKSSQSKRISLQLEKSKIDSSKFNTENYFYVNGYFKDEKEAIHYHQKYLQIGAKNYLLTVWIRGDERNRKYKDSILGILNSFKKN